MKGFFSIGKKGSLVLALALVCLLAAGAAWAEETGTCGANLRWTLSDQGTLKITGTGPMTDYAFYDGYSSGTQSPWVSSGASFFISRIEIGEGVTSVGSYAFIYFDMLEEVSLPSTLTQIGESAFEQSPNLRAVSFPAALKSIGANAFHDCAALEEASFAEGLQSIGDSAFSGCGSLVSVGLPSTVRTIGRASFQGCASLRQVMLPAGLTAVPDSAFKGAGDLTYIYLPDTVTTVGTGAFEGTAGGFTVYCGEGSRAARWATMPQSAPVAHPATSNGGAPYHTSGVPSSVCATSSCPASWARAPTVEVIHRRMVRRRESGTIASSESSVPTAE